jgi:hypothetical protein
MYHAFLEDQKYNYQGPYSEILKNQSQKQKDGTENRCAILG